MSEGWVRLKPLPGSAGIWYIGEDIKIAQDHKGNITGVFIRSSAKDIDITESEVEKFKSE
jgi:hypothetical protein